MKEREVRGLEAKLQDQEETLQNMNRLLDAQERSIASLTTLQHLFSAAATPREMAVPFLDLSTKAARCEGGALALREASQGHLAVLAATGDRQELVRNQIFNEGEGLMGEVVRSGQPLLVPDARRERRLRQEGPDYIQKEPRNALCIPVIGGTASWGCLLLLNTSDRKRFNKQDVDLLSLFAMRLARELDREAESSRTREEATRFSTLMRVTELLHVSTDRHKVWELLMQLAQRLTKAQGAAVFSLDESQQLLTCVAATESQSRPVRVSLGTGIVGWVALEGQPVNVNVNADAKFAGQAEPLFSFRSETVAAVPVRGAKRIIGALEVVNKLHSGMFDAGDLSLMTLLAREAGIALDHLQQSRQDQATIMELLRGLAKFLDAKAPHLAGHSERVAKVTQTLAEELGLPPDEVGQAYMAGLLHDVGNVGIDDELLMAPRALTAEETKQVRQHTSIGAEILRDVEALRHLMVGPLYHHERFDGTGYPQGLKGEAIPLLSRIIGVAEAFDALRSNRPYREGKSIPDTLAQIRGGEGTLYDPKVVAALMTAYQRGKLPV